MTTFHTRHFNFRFILYFTADESLTNKYIETKLNTKTTAITDFIFHKALNNEFRNLFQFP